MADDRGKNTGRTGKKPVRPTIPGTLPRKTDQPGRTTPKKQASQPKTSQTWATGRAKSSTTGKTRSPQTRVTSQSKAQQKPRKQAPRTRKPVSATPTSNVTAKKVLKILAMLAVLAGLVVAGLFIKGKLNEHAETLKAASSSDDTEIVACTPDQLEMSTTWSDIVAGQPVLFTIGATNTSDKPCSLDAGGSSLVLNVESGTDQIWNSSYCRADSGSRLYVLGEGKSTEIQVSWDGLRNTSDCQTGLAAPRAGMYVLTGKIGGVDFPGLRSVTELVNSDGSRAQEVVDAEENDTTESDSTSPADDTSGTDQQGTDPEPTDTQDTTE